jgi:hypothetical protein
MDISPALLTIVGSLIALGGVWLGRHLERRNETMKWRRDRLLDAFSEFVRAMDLAVEAGKTAYWIECGTKDHEEQKRIALAKAVEMSRVSDRILLLASAAVEAPFQALVDLVRTEMVPIGTLSKGVYKRPERVAAKV